MASFDTLYAHCAENQSMEHKQKPLGLAVKEGDKNIKMKISGTGASLLAADIIAMAAQRCAEVTFTTPIGKAKGTKTFTLTRSSSELVAADMIGVIDLEEEMAKALEQEAKKALEQRGESVSPNVNGQLAGSK